MLMQMKVNRATILVDGVKPLAFMNNDGVWNKLLQTANDAGLTILNVVKHDFYPIGLSGAIIIGESHITIHTFPENNEAWIEIATCVDDDGDIRAFIKNLPKEWKIK